MSDRRAPGYWGAAVEDWVIQTYDLERTYETVEGVRLDAKTSTGRPVEIKAVSSNRRGGRSETVSFKIWQDQHETVESTGGLYVFVSYEILPAGRIGIKDHIGIPASDLDPEWYGRTEPRGEPQAEIKTQSLFQ